MSRRRVVVTGIGMVSPVGNTVDASWRNILAGVSGAAAIEAFDAAAFPTRFSASVKGFDPAPYLEPKEVRRMDLFIQFGMAAGVQAMADSGLELEKEDLARIGTAIGTGTGGLQEIENGTLTLHHEGPRKVSPFFVTSSVCNMVAGNISIRYQLRGPNITVVTACTSGTHNIGLAARMVERGDADVMVCGGSEMATTPLGIGGFAAARALSTRNDDPEGASRPWDRERDGFVLGDGAGVLVLEEFGRAKARGARIYAELAGFGMSADGHHITAPPEDGRGACLSMEAALRDAGINAAELNYINAHGTSTKAGDLAETVAIKAVMGDAAKRVAVSSTKSMTGHLLGAGGAVEAIFAVLSIRDQAAPPTINLHHPDDGCDLNYVPHAAQEMRINYALSNSFGFGGSNSSLLFKKLD